MQARIEERPLSELVSELASKAGTLFRQELRLARLELSENASQAGGHVATLLAGGFIAYAGFLFVLAAIVAALAMYIPFWLAALGAGVVVVLVGYVLVRRGLDALKSQDLAPRQTLASLNESAEWAKEQFR